MRAASSRDDARATRRTRTALGARAARPRSAMAIDALFLLALIALGVVSMWPIYRDPWLLVTIGVATALAVAIAVVSTRRRWRWWQVSLSVLAAYLVAGVPLAVPSALSEAARIPAALGELVVAPVTSWKNVLTLDLPLGTYQATLAPALLLGLVVPVAALAFAWRAKRAWVLAAPTALVLPLFGIVFGSSAVRGSLRVGPIEVHGVVETLTGVGALLVALAWCVWREASTRAQSVRLARRSTGVRMPRRRGGRLSRRIAGGAMVLVAVLAGVIVAPWAVAGQTRDVLRTQVDPEQRIRAALSPLSSYRENFDDDRYDTALFQVDAAGGADRVRLATLGSYDGILARIVDTDAQAPAASFVRVPSATAIGVPTTPSTVRIDAYDGIWVPVVGSLVSVAFEGADRAALTDGFFYNADLQMGVELSTPGLTAGTTLSQTSRIAAQSTPPVASLTPTAAGPRWGEDVVPASLTAWISAQDAPPGGAGLALLIDRLRARGYLSHALSTPAGAPPAWMADLGDYRFESSRAGHSVDRIDTLFRALLDRQNQIGGTDDAALVAAPGDDEQFAVASALIADQLGFTTRIVMGARLTDPPGDGGLPACEEGICRGKDMAVWIEVQDASGAWVPIDTTPQHDNPITAEVQERSDPQIPTRVTPEKAEIVPPPGAMPADGDVPDSDKPESGPDWGAVWGALRVLGIGLLIAALLCGPFLAIVSVKTLRRRARRASPDPADRVAGGWEEYVDAAVDHGHPLPRTQTRTELAQLYDARGRGDGGRLAVWADRSVFAYDPPDAPDSEAFWALVDAERARLRAESSRWSRFRARISLRSLRRALGRRGTR